MAVQPVSGKPRLIAVVCVLIETLSTLLQGIQEFAQISWLAYSVAVLSQKKQSVPQTSNDMKAVCGTHASHMHSHLAWSIVRCPLPLALSGAVCTQQNWANIPATFGMTP